MPLGKYILFNGKVNAIKLPLDGEVTILGIGLLGCLLSYFTLYIDVQTKVCCRCFLNAIQELVASVGTTAELRMGFITKASVS
jgi:hypothetical protein